MIFFVTVKHHPKRVALILHRWLMLTAYGFVAGLLVYLVAPWLLGISEPASSRLAEIPGWVWVVGVAIWIVLAVIAIARSGNRFIPGILCELRYPPPAVGAVFGLFTFYILTRQAEGSLLSELAGLDLFAGLVMTAVLFPVFFTPTLARTWRRRGKKFEQNTEREAESSASSSNAGPPKTQEELLEWIMDDREIIFPAQDRFGHAAIAQRMARRVRESFDDTSQARSLNSPPTMMLVGPRGSGKSSIGRMVEHELRNESNICFIQISLWPFQTTEAAVRGVLNALIRELGKHVSTTALSGMPTEYVKIIDAAPGAWRSLASALHASDDPERIIERFGIVAKAAGLRFVLWVEDLERFAESACLGEPREEKLGPLRACLYLLDRCPTVGVIIADASIQSAFDIQKIAHYVERIPRLNIDKTVHIISIFIGSCKHAMGSSDIFPDNPLELFSDLEYRQKFHESYSDILNKGYMQIDLAIARIVETPRTLKMSLRNTYDDWKSLSGEVEFLSVLAANCVRHAYPRLFAILNQYVNDLRKSDTDMQYNNAANKKNSDQVRDMIIEKSNISESYDIGAIKSMLNFLFPANAHNSGISLKRPQSFAIRDYYVDYWEKYLGLATDLPVSDQFILHAIEDWKSGKSSELLNLIRTETTAHHVERFAKQIDGNEYFHLLKQLITVSSTESADSWGKWDELPGLWPLARLFSKASINYGESSKIIDIIGWAIKNFSSTHIPLLGQINYCFIRHDMSPLNMVGSGAASLMEQRLLESISQAFQGESKVAEIRLAIRCGSPWTLAWIYGGNINLPESWCGFADCVFAFAKAHPDIGCPLIAPFVVTRVLNNSDGVAAFKTTDGKWNINTGWTIRFDRQKVVQLFRDWDPPEMRDKQALATCRAVVRLARDGVL